MTKVLESLEASKDSCVLQWQTTASIFWTKNEQILTLKVLNFWKFTSYCSLKPLWSGMGEVVLARTLPTLHPPSPPSVHQLSWLALWELTSRHTSANPTMPRLVEDWQYLFMTVLCICDSLERSTHYWNRQTWPTYSAVTILHNFYKSQYLIISVTALQYGFLETNMWEYNNSSHFLRASDEHTWFHTDKLSRAAHSFWANNVIRIMQVIIYQVFSAVAFARWCT